jgi:hypothetical protein
LAAPVKVTGPLLYQRSCGAMDNTSDYESKDCRFELCQDRLEIILGMQVEDYVNINRNIR